jgi:hypothetical protein
VKVAGSRVINFTSVPKSYFTIALLYSVQLVVAALILLAIALKKLGKGWLKSIRKVTLTLN